MIGVKEVYKNVGPSYVSLIFCEGNAADKATMINYSNTRADKRLYPAGTADILSL